MFSSSSANVAVVGYTTADTVAPASYSMVARHSWMRRANATLGLSSGHNPLIKCTSASTAPFSFSFSAGANVAGANTLRDA